MSTRRFYEDLRAGDISEFLAASDTYNRLTGGFEKAASQGDNMNSFLLELSRECSKKPYSSVNSLDMDTLQKIAEETGVTRPSAKNTEAFIDKVEFAADCGRDMAYDYVKQANIGQRIAKFVVSNPRAAGAIGTGALGTAGGYIASGGDGGAAIGTGLLAAGGGALAGRKLVGMAAGKNAVLGKGVQQQLRGAMRENVIRKQTAARLPTASTSEMKQVALPGMEGAVGAKPLQPSAIPAQPTAAAPVAAPAQANPAQGELFASHAGVNPYAPGSRPSANAPAQKGLWGRTVDRARSFMNSEATG